MKDAKTMAQQALDVQDACNLSGVVHSFSRVMNDLRTAVPASIEGPNKGTEWYNHHPIVILWADKCAHLTGIQNLGSGMNAYSWCQKTAKGERPNDFEYEDRDTK